MQLLPLLNPKLLPQQRPRKRYESLLRDLNSAYTERVRSLHLQKPSTTPSATSSRNLAVRDAPSPRVGSADSFDVVSSTTTSVASDTVNPAVKKAESDDDDEEEDTDDDEEDSDSDWE